MHNFYLPCEIKKSNGILQFLANVTNVYNLIGREDYNIGRIVLSVSILCPLQKKHTCIRFLLWEKISIY